MIIVSILDTLVHLEDNTSKNVFCNQAVPKID